MMWKGIRNNLGFSLLLILLLLIGLFATVGMLENLNMPLYQTTEKVIASKYSENGSYFGPVNFLVSEDGKPNRISRNKMYHLQTGDTFEVREGFTTYDLLLIVAIALMGVPLYVATIWILTSVIFGETRWVKWLNSKIDYTKKTYKHGAKITGKILMITCISISVICLCLIGKNIFYKVIPAGKTMTHAEILDREKEQLISPYTITTTYTLTLEYSDHNNKRYETKKDVSHFTYEINKHQTHFPITYRNKRPYDVFIKSQSFREYISSMFRIETGIILLVIYFNAFLIRKYLIKN